MTLTAPPSFATLPLMARIVCGWLGLALVFGALRLSILLREKSSLGEIGYQLVLNEALRFWVGAIGLTVLAMVSAFLAIVALIRLRAPSSIYLAAFANALIWPIPQLFWRTADMPFAFSLLDIVPTVLVFLLLFATPSIGAAFALRTPFNNRESRSKLIHKIRGRD
jgi:hypothetical protein